MKRVILLIVLFFTPALSAQSMAWRLVTKLPIAVTGARAVARDSLIYVIGGYSDSLRTRIGTIQEYNPRANTWRILGNLAGKRVGFIAKKLQDSIIVLGGISNNIPYKSSMEVWRTDTLPYTLTHNENFDRSYATGQIIKHKLYLFGGIMRNRGKDTSNHYLVEYDLKSLAVTYQYDSIIAPNYIPTQQMSEVLGANIFLFGGLSQGIISTIHRFNTVTRAYTKMNNSMPRGRANGTAVVIDSNKIMIIGGYNESSYALPSSEIYTIAGNMGMVQNGPTLVNARTDHCAVRHGNSIFVFGGMRANGSNLNSVERLDLVTDINERDPGLPPTFALRQNYPNPFNPGTTIAYEVFEESTISLAVYSPLGERVKQLYDGLRSAGEYSVVWDGSDESNAPVPAGIYFYRLSSAHGIITKKMVLLK